MSKQAFIGASLCLASFVLCSGASAASVAIVNPSFEDDVLGEDGTALVIAGWSGTGVGGFRPIPANTGLTPTDGVNTAFSNGGALSQNLVSVLASGTSYVLQVDVGDRSDLVFPAYKVQLFAGANLLAEDDNTLTPDSGFLTSTVTYTSSASDPFAGQQLRIELFGAGVQVNFDNVRLDASPVPEPSPLLIGLASLGFWSLLARRRSQRA